MGAGGKPDDADALRVDTKFFCPLTNQAESALRVLNGWDVLRNSFAARNSIFKQHSGHTNRVQPRAYLCPFNIHGETDVTTTRAYKDRSTGIDSRIRRIDRNRWRRNIADAHHDAPSRLAVSRNSHIDF